MITQESLVRLEALKAEYLLTLDDEKEYAAYGTHRLLATNELVSFFDWLKARKG